VRRALQIARRDDLIVVFADRIPKVAAQIDFERRITLSVGTVRGGTRPNVIPDLAEAEIDVRFRAIVDGERVREALRKLQPTDPRIVAAAFAAARQVAEDLGLPPLEEVATGGACEASFAAALGLPTLDGLGADGDGAHAEHEHVVLSSLPERAALATGLIERLAGRTRTESPT
jgi:glutamate carboxypeptidase